MRSFTTLLAAAAVAATGSAAQAQSRTEVSMWHAMTGGNGERINEMVAGFNDSQDKYTVVSTYKGSYPETLTAAIAAFRAGNAPAVLQVQEVATATFMAATGAVRPVSQVMEEAGAAFDPQSYVRAVTGYYSTSDGRMLSFPFNSSTPVLYYNKDLFSKAGLDPENPPATWEEMGEATRKLRDAGVACGFTTTWPSWIQLENLGARHGQTFATNNNGFDGLDTELEIEKPLYVRHITQLGEWQKTRQFDYGGRTNKALPKFTGGECAMLTESSAGFGNIKNSVQFEWGIAPLPYWAEVTSEPSNTIIGGASLWVMNGKRDEVYDGVAAFFTYLSRPDVQAKWHQESGYLPITPASAELTEQQGFYAANPGTDVALKQMRPDQPATIMGVRLGNFVQIRDVIEEELEKVWAGSATAETALKAAAERGDAELRKFEKANPAR